jgi:hypothetical protein
MMGNPLTGNSLTLSNPMGAGVWVEEAKVMSYGFMFVF